MDNFCISCLSIDRKLWAVDKYMTFFFSFLQFDSVFSKKNEIKICWECKALLRRFVKYKENVQKSKLYLEEISKYTSSYELKSLSNLTVKKLESFDSSEPSRSEVIVKTEYLDVPLDTEQFNLEVFEPEKADSLSEVSVKDEDIKKVKVTKRKKKSKNDNSSSKKNIVANFNEPLEPWRTEVMTEEEMLEWRREESINERYLKLPRKCSSCLVAYHFEDQLVQHNMKFHYESLGGYICNICQCRYPEDSLLAIHRLEHYKLYKCSSCDYHTKDHKKIIKHYSMEHSDIKYKCKQCDATFKSISHLRYHKDDKHGKRWQCRHCDKTFRLRNNMYSHMLIHKDLPSAKCDICQKVTKNKYTLKIHLKIHEEQKKTFYCQLCDSHYKTENSYKHHFNTSMKHLKPEQLKFECDECGRKFVTEKRRRRHHSSVHLKKGEFPCERCPKSYSTKLALNNHISQKHENSYKEPPRDKICDVCGKGFAVIGILKAHMRTHTGERPFHCQLCPSTFSHQAALYTHNKLVHQKIKRKKIKKTDQTEVKKQWDYNTSF